LFEYARSFIEERRESFDARFGTDTCAPTFERNQKTKVHFYVPTTASVIYEILRALPPRQQDLIFLDMGSGKGRALLIASEFPFKKIIGIEISEQLHRIAEENVKRYRPATQQCRDIDLICGDVLDYAYGDDPIVLFLFDPFGRDILIEVIAKLEASLKAKPREAFVVYVYPQFEDVLQNSTKLRKMKSGGPQWQPWSQYVIYAHPAPLPITATERSGGLQLQIS
jgi:SAM-dependent methyltransferase